MRWIAVLLATITATNAVSLEHFYALDPRCSCSNEDCCNGDYKCICQSDDDSSGTLPITLSSPLPFYGHNYTYVFVNTNGILVLLDKVVYVNETLYYFQNDSFPIEEHVFIAPFYGDIDTRSKGIVRYSEAFITDSDLLKKAENHVQLTKYKDFSPKYLLIATWDDVGYYDKRNDKLNTFQCVIATDGNITFAIFLYYEIEWTTADGSTPAKVGFNDGEHNRSWEMPCSGTEDIANLTSSSNIGEPGIWIVQVDGTDIILPCPNEDKLTDCESGMCSCLTEDIQQECQCDDQDNTVCIKPFTPPTGGGMPPNKDPPGYLIAICIIGGLLVLISLIIFIVIVIVLVRKKGGSYNVAAAENSNSANGQEKNEST